MFDIDIGLITTASMYYMLRGYKPLPAPMVVDGDILGLTLPEGRRAMSHLNKFYVGSAEQSFYQLIKEGLKPEGSYMMMTPCHRDEIQDENHLNIFLKIELISMTKTPQLIARDVHDFYTNLGERVETVVTEDPNGCDLEVNGMEVGSFGCRFYQEYLVNYGTGLALPRFSQARKNKNTGLI